MDLGYVPKGKKLEPVVSEFRGHYFFRVNPLQESEPSTPFPAETKELKTAATTIAMGESSGRWVVEDAGPATFGGLTV
jgi:hypothetical protein